MYTVHRLSNHILCYLSFGVHIHVALRVNCNNSGCFKMLSFVNSNMKKWNKNDKIISTNNCTKLKLYIAVIATLCDRWVMTRHLSVLLLIHLTGPLDQVCCVCALLFICAVIYSNSQSLGSGLYEGNNKYLICYLVVIRSYLCAAYPYC